MAKEKAKEEEKEDAAEKEEKEEKKEETAEGEGGEAAEGEGAAPKKSKKKIIILGVVALVVVLAGGAGAYFAFFAKHQEKAAAELDASGKPIEKPVYYTLPEFLINLNAGGKQTSFLKTTVILELSKQEEVPMVEANMPRLLDAINTYLRELRASDLAGSAGIQRLREELMLRANKALSPVKVNDVLFKEIIIQ
ncbi:MAG: flagellar basal body-associated FliL family protein [Pseudomonadota bacterium]|nr:flagellar basal body-associated FliL family protein [Pseudomonadota bacterium]